MQIRKMFCWWEHFWFMLSTTFVDRMKFSKTSASQQALLYTRVRFANSDLVLSVEYLFFCTNYFYCTGFYLFARSLNFYCTLELEPLCLLFKYSPNIYKYGRTFQYWGPWSQEIFFFFGKFLIFTIGRFCGEIEWDFRLFLKVLSKFSFALSEFPLFLVLFFSWNFL